MDHPSASVILIGWHPRAHVTRQGFYGLITGVPDHLHTAGYRPPSLRAYDLYVGQL